MKMLAIEKHEWIEALLSGKYKQGTEVLHEIATGEFCFLGVLCDLVKERYSLEVKPVEGFMSYNDDSNGLPNVLFKKYHCDYFGPIVPVNMLTSEELVNQNVVNSSVNKELRGVPLSDLNDSGMSFTRIAELVDLCVEAI